MFNIKINNVYFFASAILIIVAALGYAVFNSLVEMEAKWGRSEEYGYAYMLPFITMYFIWQKFGDILEEEYSFSWIGACAIMASMFVMSLGILSATHSIAQYGFIFSLLSLALMLFGWKIFRVVVPFMLLLLLVVPLPSFLFNNLSSYLQLISSSIGVWVIRLFGISVYLEGNVIDLGAYKLQVVEACSGLRYLFPLFSLAVIASFIFKAALWMRVIIVLSSLPITVFMNSFRVGMIGVLVEYWGIEQAEGFLHDFEGWVIFMACTALLILEMWFLIKIMPGNKTLGDVFAVDAPDSSTFKFKPFPVDLRHIIALGVVLTVAIIMGGFNEREEIILDREKFATFPLSIEDWDGRRKVISTNVLDELKLTDYIIADYRTEHEDEVNLYLAYYESQRSGVAAHSPKSCIPGGGWRIKSHTTIDIGGVEKSTNRLLIRKGDHGQLVYYWFDQRGRNITNEYLVKWYLFWDSLRLGRTDGALVRLTTTIKPGEDVAKADKRLSDFALLVQPVFSEYIPE